MSSKIQIILAIISLFMVVFQSQIHQVTEKIYESKNTFINLTDKCQYNYFV